MRDKTQDWCFFIFLIFALFIFYPDLFLAKSASLMGDHIEQHYPWTFLLAESLKHFQFPWWTNLIQCGFPIAAEGQIGAFYLPNILLCFFLPIHWAYSYLNLIHFFLAGVATYLYARVMKLSLVAAGVASFIFVFGAAYGGAYYNIISLKTIAWFPLSLFFFESYYRKRKSKHLIVLSVSTALSLLAGYLQIAILSFTIFNAYVICRIFIFKGEKGNTSLKDKLVCLFFVGLAMGVSFLLALPQLLLTFQLVLFSSRINLTESYAYVGSMSPLALLTFLFIEAQGFLRGNSLYGGVWSLFFILCAFYSNQSRKSILFNLWCAIGAISFLLALGEWSPFYVLLVKLTHFYSFRIPAKFLVFTCFSAAMLSGIGVETLWNSVRLRASHFSLPKVSFVYALLTFSIFVWHGLSYLFLTMGRSFSLETGKWFARQFIHGKTGHPYSLQVYYEKLQASLDSIGAILSLDNPWNIWNYFLFVVGLLFILHLKRSNRVTKISLALMLCFLFIDLYAYAWRDIKRDFDTYQNVSKPSAVVEYLAKEKISGALGRICGLRNPDESLPVVPSMNMLYGFEDIGAYSPLIMKRYHETVGRFGNVNDSNLAFSPDRQFLNDHIELLDALGVTHIMSKAPLGSAHLQLVLHDEETSTFLYKNKGNPAAAFFVSNAEVIPNWELLKERLLQPHFNPRGLLLMEPSEFERIQLHQTQTSSRPEAVLNRLAHLSDSERWSAKVNQSGFFVLSNVSYPGWVARLNGKQTPLLTAYGLFQAVWIDQAGEYQIEFHYKPLYVN